MTPETEEAVNHFVLLCDRVNLLRRQLGEAAREKALAAKDALDLGAKNVDLARAAGIHDSNICRLLRTLEPARHPTKNSSRGGTKS